MKRIYTEPTIETVIPEPSDCLLASPEDNEATLSYGDLSAEIEDYLDHGKASPR